jgi:hypothetical protein
MRFFKIIISKDRPIAIDPFDINRSLFQLDWDIWLVWHWIGQTAEIDPL